MKNVPTSLSNLKSKVDRLDVDILVPVPVDLSKLSDLVKDDVVKKDVFHAYIRNIEDKIPIITNLATNTTLNAKINEVKNEVPIVTTLATYPSLNAKINEAKGEILITNLARTITLPAAENKVSNVNDLIKKADYDAETKDSKNEYIVTSDYNKITNNIFDKKITVKNVAKKSGLNEKTKTLATKEEIKNYQQSPN